MNIVLVHGVLGAHLFIGKPYFNGVAKHFRDMNHNVLESDEKAIGTVLERSKELRKQIVDHFGDAPSDKLIIIAHSMGGLDARQMLRNDPELAKHVRSLTCVATPHHGSPIATHLNKFNLLSPIGDFLDDLDPDNPLRKLHSFVGALNAVEDLSEDGAKKIDANCPDYTDKDHSIRYREVVGIGRGEHGGGTAKFFKWLSKVVGGVNDGVVAHDSALPPGRTLLEEVHADHADLVGHDADDIPDFRPRGYEAYMSLYERIVAAAIA
jgi:triacylglycerol lipase